MAAERGILAQKYTPLLVPNISNLSVTGCIFSKKVDSDGLMQKIFTAGARSKILKNLQLYKSGID